MAEAKDYKVLEVGPVDKYDWEKDGKTIKMKKYALLLEGEDDWVKMSQSSETKAPEKGDTIRGTINDDEKWGKTLRKERQGFGGGGRYNPGAAYSAAQLAAIEAYSAFLSLPADAKKKLEADAKKAKTNAFELFLSRIQTLMPKMKQMVDDLAGTAKPEEKKSEANTEAGESDDDEDISIEDLDDDEEEEEKPKAKAAKKAAPKEDVEDDDADIDKDLENF